MFGNMTIGKRITIGFVFATSLAIAVIVAMNQRSMSNLAEESVQAQLHGYALTLKNAIQAETRRGESMSALVANIPAAHQLFANKDRQGLFDMFVPSFKVLKKDHGVRQFQFHTPPATSFARIHKPKKFGDDLSSFRKTVVNTNEKKEPTVGTEVGVAGLGVRGMVPVLDEGSHIGSIEFGLSFGQSFFNQFKKDYGVETALYLKRGDKYQRFASTFGEVEPVGTKALDAAFSGTTTKGTLELADIPMATIAEPFSNFSGDPIGVIVIGSSTAASAATLASALNLSLLIAGFAFFVSTGLAILISRSITRPILGITSVMEKLSQGELETEVPAQNRTDEVGIMARSVEVFKKSMQEARKLEQEQALLKKRSEEEKREMMNSLAEDFNSNVGGIIETVSSASAELNATAQSMASISEQTSSQASAVAAASEEASANVQTVAAATEQMSATVQEINQQVADASQASKKAVEDVATTAGQMKNLAETADKIGEVVSLIQDIAEQTNLLALNATIESARAGEAGKGFAVVASEVKALAGETAKATESISEHIQEVQSATGDAVTSIDNIGNVIRKIEESSSAIAAAMEEQGATTQEVSRNVAEAASGTQEVTSNITRVTQASQEAGAASGEVTTAAEELSRQSELMKTEVAKFLEQVRAA